MVHYRNYGTQIAESIRNSNLILTSILGFDYNRDAEVVYGERNGFFLICRTEFKNYAATIKVSATISERSGNTVTKELITAIRKSSSSIIKCTHINNNIEIAINLLALSEEARREHILNAIDSFCNVLHGSGFSTGCALCNKPDEIAVFYVNGTFTTLCEDCAASVSNNYNLLKETKSDDNGNVIGGLIGGFLGSLIGVALILLLSRLNLFASISGVVMAVCVLKGYEKFGGKINKLGIILCTIIMIVMTYLSNRIDWAIFLYQEASKHGWTFAECFNAVPDFLKEGYLNAGTFWLDIIMLYAFVALGAYPTLKKQLALSKLNNKILRVSWPKKKDQTK